MLWHLPKNIQLLQEQHLAPLFLSSLTQQLGT